MPKLKEYTELKFTGKQFTVSLTPEAQEMLQHVFAEALKTQKFTGPSEFIIFITKLADDVLKGNPPVIAAPAPVLSAKEMEDQVTSDGTKVILHLDEMIEVHDSFERRKEMGLSDSYEEFFRALHKFTVTELNKVSGIAAKKQGLVK